MSTGMEERMKESYIKFLRSAAAEITRELLPFCCIIYYQLRQITE